MTEAQRMTDLLDQIIEGEAWHADSLKMLLDGVTAEDAGKRAAPGTHSIIEIVLHMTGWTEEVRARLHGAPAGTPPSGDWPDPGSITPARWTAAREALFTAHRRLLETITGLSEDVLARPVIDPRGDGLGATGYVTAHGIIHHSVYHAGQIAVIKRAIRPA